MKTMDGTQAEPNLDACEAVALMIPWYVNGTLDADGIAQVEAHCEHCADCADDLAFERRLRMSIKDSALTDKAMERGLARAVASTEPAPMPPPARGRTRSNRPVWRMSRTLGAVMAMAACLIIAVTAVLVEGGGTNPAFQTATETGDAAELIRLQAAADASRDALQDLFAEAGVEILSGPTEDGVYTVRPTGDGQSATAIAETLEATPLVLLAIAPEQ